MRGLSSTRRDHGPGKLTNWPASGRTLRLVRARLRQEVHYLQAPPGYNSRTGLGPSIADMDLGTYIRASPGDNIIVGGTEPECDVLEWIADPDESNLAVTAESFARQATRAARRLSTLRVPTTPKGVSGVYDVTEDWQPIYDRTSLPGFYVAVGTSGNQFKNAPLVGRLMATLVERVEAGHDHDKNPVKVPGDYTQNVINLGAFFSNARAQLENVGNGDGIVLCARSERAASNESQCT